MASGNRAYKNKTGIKAHSQSNLILPALLRSLVKLSLSPHQGTRGRLIQWCECYARCDWSLPMIYQSTRHMDDVTANLFSWFVQHGARFWKVFVRLFRIRQGKASKKSLAETIYKEEKWWDGGKRVLHCFRMPKPQEIFTTVAIVCRRHEELSVLQNVFAMCWAREDFEKLFEETVCN